MYDRIRGTCSFHDDDEDEIENRMVFARSAVRIRSRTACCFVSRVSKTKRLKGVALRLGENVDVRVKNAQIIT